MGERFQVPQFMFFLGVYGFVSFWLPLFSSIYSYETEKLRLLDKLLFVNLNIIEKAVDESIVNENNVKS